MNELAQQIYQLRKENRHDEAREIVHSLANDQEHELAVYEAAAWVVYDNLKGAIVQSNVKEIISWWNHPLWKNILPTDNTILINQLFYLGSKTLFYFPEKKMPNLSGLFLFYRNYAYLCSTEESAKYLAIALIRHVETWPLESYVETACLLLESQLHETELFVNEEFNGKRIPSTWERLVNTMSKASIAELENASREGTPFPKVNTLKSCLEKTLKSNPQPRFSAYYLGKLNRLTGDTQKATAFFLQQLAMQSETWIYHELAELCDELPVQKALLLKGLSIKQPTLMESKLMEKLCHIYMHENDYKRASYWIQVRKHLLEQNGYPVPNKITYWIGEKWFDTANAEPEDYTQAHQNTLMEYLSNGVRLTHCIVSGHNANKTFLMDKLGKIYTLKGVHVGKNTVIQALVVEGKILPDLYRQVDTHPDFIQTVEGRIQVTQKGFAIVNGVFIPPYWIQKEQLETGMQVKLRACLSWNKAKEQVGWTISELLTKEKPERKVITITREGKLKQDHSD